MVAPNRIYFIYLINEFRISLYPEWQIDNGFFKGPIIVHTQILVHRWGPTTRISVVPLCGVEIAVFLVSSFFIIIIIPFYWVLNAEEVIDCSQFPIFAWDRRDRALCVKGSNLGWVSKSLRGWGVVWEEAKEIFFSPPSPYRFKPQCPPAGYIWNQDGRPYRYALEWRSYEKVLDCEQSKEVKVRSWKDKEFFLLIFK